MNFVLDTHSLVYYLLQPEKLGKNAQKAFKNNKAFFHVPTISLLEIQYLIEIERIKSNFADIINFIKSSKNFTFINFDQQVLSYSINLHDTRDPFDRIILASAQAKDYSIITRDKWITKKYNKVVW